jgi:hypothetical protein
MADDQTPPYHHLARHPDDACSRPCRLTHHPVYGSPIIPVLQSSYLKQAELRERYSDFPPLLYSTHRYQLVSHQLAAFFSLFCQ